jgi:hypothetical protein
MDSHTIAEMTSGLASRVNNLAVQTTGADSRKLLFQQDQLAKLAMAAIVQDLNAGQADYQDAVNKLTAAIAQVNASLKKAAKVAETVELVAQAIAAVGKILAV